MVVDEGMTLTYWLQLRTFFLTPLADPIARKLSLQILNEDRATVEAQGASPVPLSVKGDLSIRADALSLAYRRRLARVASDALDTATVARLAQEGRHVVILSPARRADGSASSFVLPAIPIQPHADDGERHRS